jgi:hypothetical protein
MKMTQIVVRKKVEGQLEIQLESANLHTEAINSKRARFLEIDSYCRDFDEKRRDWLSIGKACVECRDEELWHESEKHYPGFKAWIEDAMPTSVRTAYHAMSLYESLKDDYSFDELKEMPTETAKVVAQLPKSARKNPKVRAATKQKRKEFIETVQEAAPEQHLELDAPRTFNFSESQWKVAEEAIETYRLIEDNLELPAAEAIEAFAAEWLTGDDGIYSRQERGEQLRAFRDGTPVPEPKEIFDDRPSDID